MLLSSQQDNPEKAIDPSIDQEKKKTAKNWQNKCTRKVPISRRLGLCNIQKASTDSGEMIKGWPSSGLHADVWVLLSMGDGQARQIFLEKRNADMVLWNYSSILLSLFDMLYVCWNMLRRHVGVYGIDVLQCIALYCSIVWDHTQIICHHESHIILQDFWSLSCVFAWSHGTFQEKDGSTINCIPVQWQQSINTCSLHIVWTCFLYIWYMKAGLCTYTFIAI